LIKHTALFDDVPLTAADVQLVTITIYNAAEQVVEPEIPMTWNAAKTRWEFGWDTSPGMSPGGVPLAPGRYRLKVYILSVDGAENFEWAKIRLKASPI